MTPTDSERLELLEAELARLTTAREREQQQKQALANLLGQGPPIAVERHPEHSGFAGELQKRQEQQRQERIRVAAEREARHDRKLERNATKIEKLNAELSALGKQVTAEQSRHFEAHAAITGEIEKLRGRLAALEAYDDPVEPASPPGLWRSPYDTTALRKVA